MEHNIVKNELIKWYLNYSVTISDKEIYDYSKLYNIPFQIFIKKLLERLITIHKYDITAIIDILQNKLLLKLTPEIIEYVTELVKILEPITIIDYRSLTTDDVAKLKKNLSYFQKLDIISDKKETHSGQPLPDPNLGRPYIDWQRCYHDGCHTRFSTPNELIKHLKQFKVYTPNYHKFHEETVAEHKLTEQIILDTKLTKCPAIICKISKFNTPQDLITHYQELGILPFWKKGLVIKKTTDYKFNPELKIYNNNECVICCENKPNIIFDTCMHCCFCIECYAQDLKHNSITKCPVCRGFYNKIYPY